MGDDAAANPGSERETWSRPTARLDWLAGPIADVDADGLSAAEVWLDDAEPCSRDRGFPRYNRWLGDRHNGKVAQQTTVNRRGQTTVDRTYLVAKGTTLMRHRDEGRDDFDILALAAEWRFAPKRIDLAVDVRNPAITPHALYQRYLADCIVTRCNKPRFWGDHRTTDGCTFYLSATDWQLRVYNKSAERQAKGYSLVDGVTRFEIELRKKQAARAYAAMRARNRHEWDDWFPRFACETILSKARFLEDPRPADNPQRAATWSKLMEAFENVGPVRLPKIERHRAAFEKLHGRGLHLGNNRKLLGFWRVLLGDTFREFIADAPLSDDDEELLQTLLEDPERLRNALAKMGLVPDQAGPLEHELEQQLAADPPDSHP